MRLLLVEDDRRIALAVADYLRREHHVVDIVHDGVDALDYALSDLFDLIILDVMLPRLDGVSVCRRLRGAKRETPIMMLTARSGAADTVDALDAGADDYLAKPFDPAVLSARVRALGRRSDRAEPVVLRHGALELDRRATRAAYARQTIVLTPTEFAILEILMRHPMQIFSSNLLLEKVTPLGSQAGPAAVKVHIGNLRRKMRRAGCAMGIETHHGLGYRLADVP